jgi:hypothetical protein
LAFSILTLTCNDYVSLQQLEAAITNDLKVGDARIAWKKLEKLHKPTNSSDQHELEQKYNHSELKSNSKNPDEWFVELERLRAMLENSVIRQ